MKKFIGFIALAGLLAFMSCSKDRIQNDEKKDVTFKSLDDFYKNNAVEEQTFIIDSLGGDTIYGKDGTKIWGLSKTKFMTKSTRKDIFYPYTLKLIEAYNFINVIMSRLPTVAQGKLLSTAGELKITAFKNGEELMLKENKSIQLWTPLFVYGDDRPDYRMELFYGFTKGTTKDWNNDILATDYAFQWADSVNSNLSVFKKGYSINDAKLGWINCDHFYNYPNLTTVNFIFKVENVLTNVDLSFVDLYIVYKNIPALQQGYNPMSGMPVGEPISVVAIGEATNGKMYSFKGDYIITADMIIDVDLTLTTEEDIKTMLQAL